MPALGLNSKTALSIALSVFILLPAPMLAASTSNKKPQYLPPVAPTLDVSGASGTPRTTDSAAPSPAPSPYPASSAAGDYSLDRADNGNSDQVKSLMRQALSAHNNGDRNSAQKLFRQVLSIDPHNADANFNLGAMAEDSGDLNGALYYYQTASRLSPGDSDLADAVKSVQSKMQQQKVAQQTTTQLQEKQQLRGIAQDAAAAYKSGQYDRAISDLQQVVQRDPNDPNALFGLGQAYRGKKDFYNARHYLSQAAALDPSNQLYQATLRDLDSEGGGRGEAPQTAEGPQPAPDFRQARNSGSDYYGRQSQSPSYGWQGGASMATDPNQQAGQLTAFTDQGQSQLQGHASRYGGGMGGMGMGMGGGGMGSMMGPMGAGLLAGGLSRMMNPGYSYYGGTGSRLMRGGLMGGLAGAAVGGLMNMNQPGGFSQGAMRGGLTGGLMGLMTGF